MRGEPMADTPATRTGELSSDFAPANRFRPETTKAF